MFNPKIFDGKRFIECPFHPDTEVRIEGVVAHWNIICEKLIEIGNYLPRLKYMGFDIIVTEDSFMIIEINSLTALTVMPVYYPLLTGKYNERFFAGLFKKRKKHLKRLLNNFFLQ